jgi:hypothetical protein
LLDFLRVLREKGGNFVGILLDDVVHAQ